MELKLVRSKNEGDKEYKVYQIGAYEVGTSKRDGQIYNISVWTNCDARRSNFLPEIYLDDMFERGSWRFSIQTTSYGSLQPEDIEKVIAGYKQALEVVAVLEKTFLQDRGDEEWRNRLSKKTESEEAKTREITMAEARKNKTCEEFARCQQNILSSSAERRMGELEEAAKVGLRFEMTNRTQYMTPNFLGAPKYKLVASEAR